MLTLEMPRQKRGALKVLCLGAHCDDIEIGCGGTILKLVRSNENAMFYWVVFSSEKKRKQEARESANLFLKNVREKTIIIKNFRNGFFPFVGMEIKEYFEDLKHTFSPDLIFTHYRNDLHQDHRLISDLTWNTFRDHLILEYEIFKYDGDLGTPNVFVHLDEKLCQNKISYIQSAFRSQKSKNWFNPDVFLSMLRLRGVESNAPGKYAEAYYGRKVIL
jgi:LmbE family N-acetylglucosaminyl deacetylase